MQRAKPKVRSPKIEKNGLGNGQQATGNKATRHKRRPISLGSGFLSSIFALRTSIFCATVLFVAFALPSTAFEPQSTEQKPSIIVARDLFLRGDYKEALADFETLAGDPVFTLEATLGAVRCRVQIGQFQDALDALQNLEADDVADRHYLLAQLLERLGRYDDVIRHARRAIELDDNHAGARLLLGGTLDLLGRRDEAVENDRWFEQQVVARADLPRDAEWVTNVARGFIRYSVWTRTNVPDRTRHVLHNMLQMVYERLDRTYWPARIAAADLLRERYNNDENHGSLSDYRAALRINPHLPQAHVGIGEVALTGWNFEEAETWARRALDVNPRFAPALHLLVRKLILERRYEEALEICQQALEINPHDLTALSLAAAARACRFDDDAVREITERVKAINPRCALLYRTLGDALGGIRQYSESEDAYRKAIELDPSDANARTELGMMYMQWGRVEVAREALEAAWELDPFNQRTQFTLELLSTLEHFAGVETENFIVKYDADVDRGIGRFLADYLEEIYPQVTADFETKPDEKTIVEIYPTRRAFGVRVTGKPWIHTIGACTGRVIALASPRDRAHVHPYDLARVLKHEFTHTVTLAATKNRIPHWLTEGLAVLQEDAPRSFQWWQLLADAARRDRLFTLQSIDWGFIRPRRPSDRTMAYAQSEWMCQFIIERFGYDAIGRLIDGFREGKTQDDLFPEQLGLEPSEFDRDFQAWARQQLTRIGFDLTPPEDPASLIEPAEENPEDAALHGRLARALFDEEQFDAALRFARRTLDLDPNEPNALKVFVTVLAQSVRKEKNERARRDYDDQALPALKRLAELDSDGWTAPKLRAEIAVRREQWDDAVEHFQRLQRLCPIDPASWRGLAGIYLKRGQEDLALPHMLELARMEEGDPDFLVKIADIFLRRDRLAEARHWYARALFLDPYSTNPHEKLGDTCLQAGDTDSALRHYEMLTKLDARNAQYFEKAAFAAHRLGRFDDAARFAEHAVEIDPHSTARPLLTPPIDDRND